MKNQKTDIAIEWEITSRAELEEYISKAITATLQYENIDFNCAVEVLVVDEQAIREMNYKYRNIDRVTDVLSFPLYENAAHAKQDQFIDGAAMLGNVVICLSKAEEQAIEYAHSLQREICFLAVHSVLHLLGYDHELGDREESEMFQKQKEILEIMGVKR